jgi:hypothetical protein
LIGHLSFTLREIAPVKRKELERWTPQRIRRDSVGEDCEALLIVDAKNEATTFDMEKAAGVLLPAETEVAGVALQYQRWIGHQKFYVASRRGIATVTGLKKPFDVRVPPLPPHRTRHMRLRGRAGGVGVSASNTPGGERAPPGASRRPRKRERCSEPAASSRFPPPNFKTPSTSSLTRYLP